MKKFLNKIKTYINDYNRIQTEYLQTQGSCYLNAQLFAMSQGVAMY